jgi:hypothetical protein
VQQKFALRVKARFNRFRDSAGCIIAMQWQRRTAIVLKTKLSFLKPGQGTVHIFCEHLSPGDESACHPKPKYLRQVERNPCDAGATIWRTTGGNICKAVVGATKHSMKSRATTVV